MTVTRQRARHLKTVPAAPALARSRKVAVDPSFSVSGVPDLIHEAGVYRFKVVVTALGPRKVAGSELIIRTYGRDGAELPALVSRQSRTTFICELAVERPWDGVLVIDVWVRLGDGSELPTKRFRTWVLA